MYDERIDGAPVVADEGLMVPAEPMGKVVMPKTRYTTEDVTASDYNARAFACPVELSAFKMGAWYFVIINGVARKAVANVWEDGAYIKWGAGNDDGASFGPNEDGNMEIWFVPIVLDEAWEETGITVEIREAKGGNVADAIWVKTEEGVAFPTELGVDNNGNLYSTVLSM